MNLSAKEQVLATFLLFNSEAGSMKNILVSGCMMTSGNKRNGPTWTSAKRNSSLQHSCSKMERYASDRWNTQWTRNWLHGLTQTALVNRLRVQEKANDEWCSSEVSIGIDVI